MGTIAKVTAGGATHLIASTAYGTCPTGATTAAKVATIQDSQAFSLIVGETVHIYFTYNNSADAPTLNVNSTGAKPIRFYSTAVPKGTPLNCSWKPKSLVSFTYNTDLVSTGCWLMNDISAPEASEVFFDYQDAQTEGFDTTAGSVQEAIIDAYAQATEGSKLLYSITISGTSASISKSYTDITSNYNKIKDIVFTASDGLNYYVVSTTSSTNTIVLSAVDTTNSCIKIITLSASSSTGNLSGTVTTIPVGSSGGGGYVLYYGSSVTVADVLDAIQNNSVLMCYVDNDPNWCFGYLQHYITDNYDLDGLVFVRTIPNATGTTVYKYIWDYYTQTSTGDGWSTQTYVIPNAYPYLQATGSGTVTLAESTMTQITLTSTGQIAFGTGLSVVSGGIKVANAGVYRVSGSVHIQGGSSPYRRGVFLRSGASYADSTEFLGTQTSDSVSFAGGLNIGPKLISLSANDIVFLCARSSNGNGSVSGGNSATYLLVEQVVSQGDAGISQQLNYLPNADTTEY